MTAGRNPRMILDYAEDLALWRTGWAKVGLAAGLAAIAAGPFVLDGFWLLVLAYAGVAAIGAIGLNILTGYTGEVSLGHAFFLAAGAYTASVVGQQMELPLPVWLSAAMLIGLVLGALVGPFALRFRGIYLIIVTLGLVFFGEHLWRNWHSLTGGPRGISVRPPLAVGPLDFGSLSVFGTSFSRQQGLFWLIWGLVALTALLTKNLVRTRPGRAMQAIRDHDIAAEVIGISLPRYKIAVFAVSGGLAAVAGALHGTLQGHVSPHEFSLLLSIHYVAIIIVGGVGTVAGAIVGAVLLGGMQPVIQRYSAMLPFDVGTTGISIFALNQMLFGALIMAFLLFEPHGLMALWARVKTYFRSWPFSY
jgi:branched-chain amino acid transport system permease protein